MSKSNHDEYVAAAKEIASCLGVNLHDLISRTTPILEFSPVPIRPAVEVFLSTFAMITVSDGIATDVFMMLTRRLYRKYKTSLVNHSDSFLDAQSY